MFQYLARAKIEFGVEGLNQPDLDLDMLPVILGVKEKPKPGIPEQMPVKFGPFTLDKSPNEEIYYKLNFGEIGNLEANLKEDEAFPVSILYVDAYIKTEEGKEVRRYLLAQKLFGQLEALMRLFQDGHVYIRLHHMWQLVDCELVEDDPFDIASAAPDHNYFALYAPQPEPTNWYFRGVYDMTDTKLRDFVEVFNLYWAILQEKPQKQPSPVHIALPRFSLSYDKTTMSDRLIELMIAMEAMFGDREYQTYKIPLRCACLLFPPGEARKGTFKRVKELYDARSRILHGAHLETVHTSEDIRAFEDIVRKSILKFMQYQINGRQITSGTELDDLLFFSAH